MRRYDSALGVCRARLISILGIDVKEDILIATILILLKSWRLNEDLNSRLITYPPKQGR